MYLLALSFVAGMLTVMAPCSLSLLPIILGESLTSKKFLRPLTIILGLSLSVFIFTLVLKSSTLLIDVPPRFWAVLSGLLVLSYGVINIFPDLWDNISIKLGFTNKSAQILNSAGTNNSLFGPFATGMALGPVFSSCSPTYTLILATILPVSFAKGVVYLVVYIFGLASVLALVSLFGRNFIEKIKFAADPHGMFKKIFGILLIIIGLMILTGVDKKIETALLDRGWLNLTNLELRFSDK